MAKQAANTDTILCSAIEIIDPDQRAAYLDEICGGNPALRAHIEKLLRAHYRAGSFLEQPVGGDRPTAALEALVDTKHPPGTENSPAQEIQLDFLRPCEVPGRLGTLGSYEIIEIIGWGGMGFVLRAYDPKLHRFVAIKALKPEFAANPTGRKRFLREACAVAAVNHPHVVAIHAVDESDNTPYLVMECIQGQSLQDKIGRICLLFEQKETKITERQNLCFFSQLR